MSRKTAYQIEVQLELLELHAQRISPKSPLQDKIFTLRMCLRWCLSRMDATSPLRLVRDLHTVEIQERAHSDRQVQPAADPKWGGLWENLAEKKKTRERRIVARRERMARDSIALDGILD